MTRLRLLATSSALLAGAMPAFAADLPSRYAPAPYYEPSVPIFAWTGFYAGVNGQLGVGSFTNGGSQVFGSPIGGLGGATFGYNYQSGNLLVGAEADAEFRRDLGPRQFRPRDEQRRRDQRARHAPRPRRLHLQPAAAVLRHRRLMPARSSTARSRTTPSRRTMCSTRVITSTASPSAPASNTRSPTKISIKGEYLFTGFGSHQYFFRHARQHLVRGQHQPDPRRFELPLLGRTNLLREAAEVSQPGSASATSASRGRVAGSGAVQAR